MPMATKEEQKKYQSEWKARRRADWLAANGPCVKCGSWVDLEVDHIDPATKVDHKLWTWSKVRRDAELAKCQVLCRDHHQEKSITNLEFLHGSDHPNRIHTADQVRSIRARFASGEAQGSIAASLSLDRKTVYDVVHRRTWKHL